MRNKGDRKFNRYVKGMRRIREDRAQHGANHTCLCFSDDGQTFSRFADTPTPCSNPFCCGNRRTFDGPTIQELKAPRVNEDW